LYITVTLYYTCLQVSYWHCASRCANFFFFFFSFFTKMHWFHQNALTVYMMCSSNPRQPPLYFRAAWKLRTTL
jgi:hypothetical protein